MAFDPGDAVSRSLKMMDNFYIAMMQNNILKIQTFHFECFPAISEESYLKFCDHLNALAFEAQQIRDCIFSISKVDACCQTENTVNTMSNYTRKILSAPPLKINPTIKPETPVVISEDEEPLGTKRSPNKRDVLTCDYCELKFNSLEKMQQHVNFSHSEDFVSIFYPCQSCSLIFLSLEELHEHSLCVHDASEDRQDAEVQVCPYCSEVKSTWLEFTTHLEQQHQILVCKTCHMFFTDLNSLKEHVQKSHMSGITKEKLREMSVRIVEPKPVNKVPVNKRPFDDISTVRKRGRPRGSALLAKLENSELVKCHFCSARFNSEESLRKHIVYKHDTGELECAECKLKFKRISAFENHMRLFHDNVREVKSAFAKTPTEAKQSSQNKVLVKKEENKKQQLGSVSTPKSQAKPSCEICGEMCSRVEDQGIHKDFHTTLVPDKFLCLFCKEPAMSHKELKTHIMSEHRYRCPFCALTFWWKANLEGHLKQLHRAKTCCIMCGINLEGDELRQHIMVNHTAKKFYLCKICDSEHTTIKGMREHELDHAKDPLRPPTCDFCGAYFGTKTSLRGHILRHMFGSFSCSLCGSQCQTEDELKEHMGDHQKSQFACMCGEYFQTKMDLQTHKKITPCKPFFNQPIHRADLFVEVCIEETEQIFLDTPPTILKVETEDEQSEDIYHINIAETPASISKNFLGSLATVNKANQIVLPRQPILILNAAEGAEATLIENKAPGIMSWVDNSEGASANG
ncbi:PR domain zinc finger protein 5-like [Neocloeon triangulifer]|uniref:PR domain zinc finger protein 5-like n=1 Tax=Neocloeon triangulifer TaxID=2078957 RepID=UPI00286EF745|nr:PR domain zinc finger protein 5-like [Neocloeon triangulifer]